MRDLGEHDLIRVDLRELPEAPGGAGQVNLADARAAREALTGEDIVMRCASVHPWKDYPDESYLDLDVKGTWHTYAAAADLGIRRID